MFRNFVLALFGLAILGCGSPSPKVPDKTPESPNASEKATETPKIPEKAAETPKVPEEATEPPKAPKKVTDPSDPFGSNDVKSLWIA